jgi:predicted AAA+ superfamily ATPase
MDPALRQSYERNPGKLIEEIRYLARQKKPLIIIDEVQKVPDIMDSLQILIDDQIAQFLITGSSARKIKNLLPGRVIRHLLTPCTQQEYPQQNLKSVLINGALPGILNLQNQEEIDSELATYVSVYLEEEIRKEALVRNLAAFSQFLQLVCIESGNLVSTRNLSQEIGIAHTTVSEYFNILEDCLLVERFDPITESQTRKRLTKASKYIVFDLGVRRFGALEGDALPQETMGHLFEQWVGLELRRTCPALTRIQFWRDHSGPEVDWVAVKNNVYLPIEVKWTQNPTEKDIRHLHVFCEEYNAPKGFVIARIDRPRQLSERIVALPWQMINLVWE